MQKNDKILSLCTVNYYVENSATVQDQTRCLFDEAQHLASYVEHVIVGKNCAKIITAATYVSIDLPHWVINSASLAARRQFAKSLASARYMWCMDDDVSLNPNMVLPILNSLKDKATADLIIIRSVDPAINENARRVIDNKNKVFFTEAKFPLSRLSMVLGSRSIEMIFDLNSYKDTTFDLRRGLGVNGLVGLESLFATSIGIPKVSEIKGGYGSLHKGKSTGQRMTNQELYASGHIQKICYRVFPEP